MVHVLTLASGELDDNRGTFLTKRRLTRGYLKSIPRPRGDEGPRIALVVGNRADGRYVEWLGAVAQQGTIGAVESSVTVVQLIHCIDRIPLDGPSGLLQEFAVAPREEFARALSVQSVGICGKDTWQECDRLLRRRYQWMPDVLDWLIGLTADHDFDPHDATDRSWQEQRDCAAGLVRIAGMPTLALAAWRRPTVQAAPYLAGLIPQPLEHSMIEHDVRVANRAFVMASDWWQGQGTRCDIHVLTGANGRRLEVANINATPAETRTGSDMIYYHEQTRSMVLVQYKRLDPSTREMRVDERFRDQLDRLERISALSRKASIPHEWRLGADPCFMKLAYWKEKVSENEMQHMTPGMYLPVSYVRMLLGAEATKGVRADGQARILSYRRVERYLTGTQFVGLVKHGLVGTVGVTPEELRDLVAERAHAGQSVMVGVESGEETVRQREDRNRSRGGVSSAYAHEVLRQSG